jgi:hypothetical protein
MSIKFERKKPKSDEIWKKKIKWSKKIVIKRMSIKFERLKNHRGEIKNHL